MERGIMWWGWGFEVRSEVKVELKWLEVRTIRCTLAVFLVIQYHTLKARHHV